MFDGQLYRLRRGEQLVEPSNRGGGHGFNRGRGGAAPRGGHGFTNARGGRGGRGAYVPIHQGRRQDNFKYVELL